MAAARVHAPEPAGARVRRLTAHMHVGAGTRAHPRPGLDSGQVWLNNVLVDIYVELEQPEHPFFTSRHGPYLRNTARNACNTQRATRTTQYVQLAPVPQRAGNVRPCAACSSEAFRDVWRARFATYDVRHAKCRGQRVGRGTCVASA